MSKKIISVLLALTLALGCCSALAENTKHERVYVVTKPDGTVKSITDNIRLENTDGLEELIDRTMLTSIENLGGKESFVLDGETLTWQAKGNDISYQGTSEKTPVILPIVHLTLDGQEISAEELKDACRSGALKEAWGCGTAAVVSPIGHLMMDDEVFTINNNEIGAVTQHLYDTLTGIQWGRIADTRGWIHKI